MKTFLRATDWDELAALDRGGYDGVSLGAEFCHHRLLSPARVSEAAALCRDRGLEFSVVTPLVREAAFDEVALWLSAVASEVDGAECVFSDWGLLFWARRERLPLRAALGRLAGHQRRDPRVVGMAASSPREAGALGGSAWDDPLTAALLPELGVERVELDLLLQEVRAPRLPARVSLSICGPWIPVTLSPSCPWSSDPLRCTLPCRGAEPVVLRNSEDSHPLWSRGNTLFARSVGPPSPGDLHRLGADRLVWSEEVPG